MIDKQKNKRQSKSHQKKTIYPHISFNKKILNGVPIISGTRTAVRTIAGYYQMGMSVDEILETLSHLTHAQVHSALAYYFDHQKDIDKDILENNKIYSSQKP